MPLNPAGVPSRAAIQAAIDEAVQLAVVKAQPARGQGVEVQVVATGGASVEVAFPPGKFDEVPVTLANISGGTNNRLFQARTINVTTESMSVAVQHRDGDATTNTLYVDWVAFPVYGDE